MESNGDECQDGSYSDNDIIPANSESKKETKLSKKRIGLLKKNKHQRKMVKSVKTPKNPKEGK